VTVAAVEVDAEVVAVALVDGVTEVAVATSIEVDAEVVVVALVDGVTEVAVATGNDEVTGVVACSAEK
jgi:hypothetical protein